MRVAGRRRRSGRRGARRGHGRRRARGHGSRRRPRRSRSARAVLALAEPRRARAARRRPGSVSATGGSQLVPRPARAADPEARSSTRAPLPRGSSGGPLVDAARARCVGLNAVRVPAAASMLAHRRSTRRCAGRTEALGTRRGARAERVRLGVAVAPPRAARRLRRAVGLPERDGVLVRGVAERAAPQSSRGRWRAGRPDRRRPQVPRGRRASDEPCTRRSTAPAPTGTRSSSSLVRGTDERRTSVTVEPLGGLTMTARSTRLHRQRRAGAVAGEDGGARRLQHAWSCEVAERLCARRWRTCA